MKHARQDRVLQTCSTTTQLFTRLANWARNSEVGNHNCVQNSVWNPPQNANLEDARQDTLFNTQIKGSYPCADKKAYKEEEVQLHTFLTLAPDHPHASTGLPTEIEYSKPIH
jgi:hypothetical protein